MLESFNWTHGVYLAGTMGSETTAAKTGTVGVLRRDPMANIPFVGYDMGTYFQHWLEMGARMAHPPRLFLVNWFRKDERGKYLWPGYGENMHVLKWVLDRSDGRAGARETAVGWTPRPSDLDLRELPKTRRLSGHADARDAGGRARRHSDWSRPRYASIRTSGAGSLPTTPSGSPSSGRRCRAPFRYSTT